MDRSDSSTTVSSHLRYGDVFTTGRTATVWNVTDMDSNLAYLVQMFHKKQAFANGKSAHERMEEIPALRGRVPRYYGVPPMPHSIILGTYNGRKLRDIIWGLTNEARNAIKDQITETLRILHEAGISHRNVTSRNIIISDGHARLVGFSHASLEEAVEEEFIWDDCKEADNDNVMEMFYEVESIKAYEEATRLLESVRNGEDVATPQPRLARLLNVAHEREKLARSIMDVYKHPEPVLALALAARLARHDPDEAIDILKQAEARCNDSSIPVGERPVELILQMKLNAARYLIDSEQSYDDTAMPPSERLCTEAVWYYFWQIPESSAADDTVMKLYYELAEHLHSLELYGHAMDICIRALEGARNVDFTKAVSPHVLEEFGDLINEVKSALVLYINNIKEDMQRGGEEEHSWTPWAELPRLEKECRRAREAGRLCNQVWQLNVPEDSDMARDLPVDWTSEDAAWAREDLLNFVPSGR
ncbi:uncharacterized protein LTHEOB_5300 [Lasiodiplodia theobromae]|uniref:uncharacterized protein n=1 Tax=Lasiodiplodia theobromae TaxID=45133 RepID=UPI0015C33870|nr:uncharacterized protein LTHEOB_5300 [Lasiodiplodia theobromae]KAF4545467.1 hypothetical protein LTHEOB_5300 [Lasiodiplodia theobromae]